MLDNIPVWGPLLKPVQQFALLRNCIKVTDLKWSIFGTDQEIYEVHFENFPWLYYWNAFYCRWDHILNDWQIVASTSNQTVLHSAFCWPFDAVHATSSQQATFNLHCIFVNRSKKAFLAQCTLQFFNLICLFCAVVVTKHLFSFIRDTLYHKPYHIFSHLQ